MVELIASPVVLVRTAIAPLNAEPRVGSGMTSQVLRGEVCLLREERGEWLGVICEDGYQGWLNRGYTFPPDKAPSAADFGRISLGCTVNSAGAMLTLPLGARLLSADNLKSGGAAGLSDIGARFSSGAKETLRSAREYFAGTPYLWGGITPWGADCSGFVQRVVGIHGVKLPRDSGDQSLAGVASPNTPVNAAAGELLFFSDRSDGAITHVGIATGDGGMLHVALGRGGFYVEYFDTRGGGDRYTSELLQRFSFARVIWSPARDR